MRLSSSTSAQVDSSLDPTNPAVPFDLDTTKAEKRQRFDTLKGTISEETLKAITVRPFKLTHMTAVQEEVLGMLPGLAEPFVAGQQSREYEKEMGKRDLMVRAKTGTGKTLAFLVPAIEARVRDLEGAAKRAVSDAGLGDDKGLAARSRTKHSRSTVGTLIISPTRELATQIANEALRLSAHHEGFGVRLFVGGVRKQTQVSEWMRGSRDIVVATPGRLRDCIASEPDIVRGLKTAKMVGTPVIYIAFDVRDVAKESYSIG
jgi:ATP-dependent RNA helicase MSS116